MIDWTALVDGVWDEPSLVLSPGPHRIATDVDEDAEDLPPRSRPAGFVQ